MKRLRVVLFRIVVVYVFVAVALMMWWAIVMQFRTCAPFSATCQGIDFQPHSAIVRVLSSVVPAHVTYSWTLGLTRGIVWLPNLVLSALGYNGSNLLGWLFASDVPAINDYFQIWDRLLP